MPKGKKNAPIKLDSGPKDDMGFPVTAEEATTTAKPMKKVDAVKAAISEGVTNPTEAVEFIKKKFNVEMTPQQFSTSKFQIGKSAGEQKAPKATAPKASPVAPTPSVNGHDSMGGSPAALAATIKALVAAHGVSAVKDMADVFAG